MSTDLALRSLKKKIEWQDMSLISKIFLLTGLPSHIDNLFKFTKNKNLSIAIKTGTQFFFLYYNNESKPNTEENSNYFLVPGNQFLGPLKENNNKKNQFDDKFYGQTMINGTIMHRL